MSTGEHNGLNHHEYIDKDNKFFDHFNFCDCIWCQMYGVPILNEMHLDEGKRYWFEIPKNASSSIKDAYKGKILRICSKNSYHPGNLYHEVSDNEIPIVVYMDPIERFITLFNDYFSVENSNTHSRYGEHIFEQLGYFQMTEEDKQNLRPGEKSETIPPEKRVEIIFDNFKSIESIHTCHHFYPQTFFVDQKKFKHFELVERKDVTDRFKIYGSVNWIGASTKSVRKEHFTEKQLNLVKEIYSEDYKFIEKHK